MRLGPCLQERQWVWLQDLHIPSLIVKYCAICSGSWPLADRQQELKNAMLTNLEWASLALLLVFSNGMHSQSTSCCVLRWYSPAMVSRSMLTPVERSKSDGLDLHIFFVWIASTLHYGYESYRNYITSSFQVPLPDGSAENIWENLILQGIQTLTR